jgi:hypothetical protein
MPILQANVPQNNLATAMGAPNRIRVEYSTDILLPVPGPSLMSVLFRHYVHALMDLNEVLILTDDARQFMIGGGRFDFRVEDPATVIPRPRKQAREGASLILAAREAIARFNKNTFIKTVEHIARRDTHIARRDSLLARLAAPNPVLRELFDANLLQRTPTLFAQPFAQAATFDQRVEVIVETLLARHANRRPPAVIEAMRQLTTEAILIASRRYAVFRLGEFGQLPAAVRDALALWLATNHLQKADPLASAFQADLNPLLGFTPILPAREWALSRRERMDLVFGVPDLRGPLATDAVPPQGHVQREEFTSSTTELARLTGSLSTATTEEALTISSGTLRRALDTVYYSGAGDVNQLTGQGANALLTEQRRGVVLSLIRQFSESRQESEVVVSSRMSSSTTVVRAPGVDPRLAATHHRFKVVVPVDATVDMYDVGLTWSPRISNPFFELRKAIREAYRDARDSHRLQFYVAEPLTPQITYETYYVSETIYMNNDGDSDVSETVTLYVSETDRNDHPDFVNAIAEFSQDRGTWRNDSDEWTVSFEILSYSGGVIRAKVGVEVEDDNWQGYVTITIPVLRYDDGTVNRLAQYRVQMRDYELQRDALEAQAAQYAAIKQREFIERHERLTVLNRIVFDSLMKRVCLPLFATSVSYYKEIIARCIDWTRVKIELEPGRMGDLAFPGYPADHFVNSRGVRFFLPVIRTAENTFFDTLTACGTFQVRASVENARNAINAARQRIQAAPNQVERLDQFATEMVLGEHIEAVMSNHDHAR